MRSAVTSWPNKPLTSSCPHFLLFSAAPLLITYRRGCHMETTRRPVGNHPGTIPETTRSRDHPETTRKPPRDHIGDHLICVAEASGDHLETTRRPLGDHIGDHLICVVESIRRPLGDHPETNHSGDHLIYVGKPIGDHFRPPLGFIILIQSGRGGFEL